jgi:hypothetical protein
VRGEIPLIHAGQETMECAALRKLLSMCGTTELAHGDEAQPCQPLGKTSDERDFPVKHAVVRVIPVECERLARRPSPLPDMLEQGIDRSAMRADGHTNFLRLSPDLFSKKSVRYGF